jgi:hypothetical protein
MDGRFYGFFIANGRSVFPHKDFDTNRCFLGRRGGISPWLIAIFGENVDLLQSVLQVLLGKW